MSHDGAKYEDCVRGRKVSFLASFDQVGEIFQQLAVIYALPRYGARSLQVILPYFPGTKDRVDKDGDIATAATLARMLSVIPLSKEGPAEIVMFDIHASQERFYFSDQVVPRPMGAAHLFIDQIKALARMQPVRYEKLRVVFPDRGAWQRFGDIFGDFPQIICDKIRGGRKRAVVIKEGNPRGKPVVIVDDLVKSGETLLECRKVLMKKGATEVGAAIVHGSFEPGTVALIRAEDWAYFWTTDSCPQVTFFNRAPFKCVSLAGSIARVILSS